MIRIVFALALLAAFGREAASQDTPRLAAPKLKELVTVTGDLVRIGDLIDNAGTAANVAVFRAPDLGQTGAVDVARITQALKPHDIATVDTGGLSEVVVTRLSRVISSKDVEERVARALGGKYGFGEAGSLAFQFDREVQPIHVEATAVSDLTIARINVEPRSGRFDISLDIPGSALARRMPLRFTGTVTETVETATLTRALSRGDVIREADVTIERRPKTQTAGEVIGIDDVIGLSAKRPMRSGEPLRARDLIKADVISRNDQVTIVFEAPGIMLTVRGKALEAGARGDLISVLNIQSNRTVHAEVSGPGHVVVTANTPRVAANMASASDNRRRRAQ